MIFCLHCDNNNEFKEGMREVEVEFHSKVFKVTTEVMVCTKCGWFTCTLAQADELNRKTKSASTWRPIATAPTKGRKLIWLKVPGRAPALAYSNTWWVGGFSVECTPTHWKPVTKTSESKG